MRKTTDHTPNTFLTVSMTTAAVVTWSPGTSSQSQTLSEGLTTVFLFQFPLPYALFLFLTVNVMLHVTVQGCLSSPYSLQSLSDCILYTKYIPPVCSFLHSYVTLCSSLFWKNLYFTSALRPNSSA